MSEKMEYLPKAKIGIIRMILANDIIVKLLNYNDKDALNKPLPSEDDRKKLFGSKIFPKQFGGNFSDQQTQIRVYFPDSEFDDNGIVQQDEVYFDIVIHNDLIIMNDEIGEYTERDELIAFELGKIFKKGKSVPYFSDIRIRRKIPMVYDSNYHILRLVGKTIGFRTP